MTVQSILKTSVQRRPRRAWWPYLPAALVLVLFAAMGWGEEGLSAACPYLLLLLLCSFQCAYATFLGWMLLFISFATYTVAVAVTPHNGTLTDYIFFLSCGAVPATFLFFVRPSKNPTHLGQIS